MTAGSAATRRAGERSDRGSDRIVKPLNLRVDGLLADLERAPGAAAERHDPLVVRGRSPIGGDHRLRSQIPAVGQIVIDEILEGHLVDLLPIPPRPDVVRERADEPWLINCQRNERRTAAPSVDSKGLVGGGRQIERRACAPDQLPRMGGREKYLSGAEPSPRMCRSLKRSTCHVHKTRSQRNGGFGADSGLSRGDPCKRAIRPEATFLDGTKRHVRATGSS
jgi:hypothetical protein